MNVSESILTGLKEAVEHEKGRIQAKTEKVTNDSQSNTSDSQGNSDHDQ